MKSEECIFNCCFEPAYTIEHIAGAIGALGAPMGICPARVKKLQISTNICGNKLAGCGCKFKCTFEEALEDWFNDNKRQYLK